MVREKIVHDYTPRVVFYVGGLTHIHKGVTKFFVRARLLRAMSANLSTYVFHFSHRFLARIHWVTPFQTNFVLRTYLLVVFPDKVKFCLGISHARHIRTKLRTLQQEGCSSISDSFLLVTCNIRNKNVTSFGGQVWSNSNDIWAICCKFWTCIQCNNCVNSFYLKESLVGKNGAAAFLLQRPRLSYINEWKCKVSISTKFIN